MNERIRELLQQAKKESSQWLGSKPATTMTYDELDKFAELIVRKCAKLADEPTSHPFQSYDVMIKEHFGVKE